MNFTPRQKRQILITGKRNATLYPHSLQFYKSPPTDDISLEEFEQLAFERLKVLRLVERAGVKFNKNSKEYREIIIGDLIKMKLSHYYKCMKNEKITDDVYDERRRDHISHFILRLAYCRREDLRRWFITQEVDLFRFRFISEKTEYKKSFMKLNNLDYDEIPEDEKNYIANKLCVGYSNAMKVKNTKYYKVRFVEVLDLIRLRKIYVYEGYAYITEDDLVLTVLSAYRTHLSHALAMTSRALPQLEEDKRLISMLSTLHQRYIGTDYSKRRVDCTGEVAPEEIDSLAKTSFPLCMRNIHEVLRRNHHLKYNSRLQYGLFLKGIGLSLEDALRFWREEFTKVMDMDKFDKQYSYNIRYNYGKEGKRANFSPYSCMKIIMSNSPGPGEVHGCPFKHSDESNLRQRLQSLNLSSGGINNIVDLATKGHYQIACTRYFELTHNEATPDQGISHPNHYYEESRKVITGTSKSDKSLNAALPSTPSQKTQSSFSTPTSATPSSQITQPSSASETDLDALMDCETDMEEILLGLNGV